MNRGSLSPNPICLPPPEQSISKFLTQSGTFKDGDLRVNKDGIQIVSQSEPGAPPPIEPLDNQLSLADLEVIKVIGKGNSGNVHLVKHKLTQQFFALKVIQLNTEESTCKAISQELRINLSSQCPYLVSCYQSFYHNGLVSIILEFMDGGSLADLLKKVEKVPENMLAAICKRVLRGLCYIHHERRIIHRDLKPSNLLINHRGEVKITDFGVSKILTSTSSLANSFVGTYPYMSPERIRGSLYFAIAMGFTLCIRRSASSLASVCGRVARAQAVSVIVNRSSLVPKPSLLRPFVSRGFTYSTTATERLKSDQSLLQVIDSEINDSIESSDHDVEDEIIASSDFPFKIEDNPGHRTVTLTREYNGEQIKVEVSMPGLAMDDDEDDMDDDQDGDGRHEKANESSIPLVVTVTKKSGLSLQFSCTALPDEVIIDGLSVTRGENFSEEQLAYDGPDFQELDENMRKSFHKFLETRGIKASTTDFLYEYMMKKDSREYLLWLKKLKNFVQE